MAIAISFGKGVERDASKWIGIPVEIRIELTDLNKEKYESVIVMEGGFKIPEFIEALKASYQMCENIPVAVFVDYIKPIQNSN